MDVLWWGAVALVGIPVARTVIEALVLRPWALSLLASEGKFDLSSGRARKRTAKFCNSGWKASFYIFATAWGMWAVALQPWLWGGRGGFWGEDAWIAEATGPSIAKETLQGHCTLVRPFAFANALCQPMPWDVKVYYATQVGYYLQALFCVLWRERKKSDFYIMVAHHCVTLALLAGSLYCGAHRIGAAVLLCHDVNDAFLEVAKSARYVGREAISEVSFAIFAVSWFASRLYALPVHVIARGSWRGYDIRDFETRVGGTRAALCVWGTFNALLCSLIAMHVYWAYLILRIIARKLAGCGPRIDDPRSSDDEGDDGTLDARDSPASMGGGRAKNE